MAWSCAIVLLMISRIWTVRAPGPLDAELFAYIGREWIKGVIPYRQLWDNKPPGIFAVNALAALTHRQFPTLALFEFAALLLTIISISSILSEFGCSASVRWAAPIVAASILTIPFYSQGGNLTEIYILPFASGCIYAFLRATRSASAVPFWLIMAGMSAGIASAFKPVGIACLLSTTVFSLIALRESLKSRVAAVVLAWTGFLLIWAGIEAYFAVHGAARQLIEASLFYNLHYGAATHYSIVKSIALTGDRLSGIGCVLGCSIVCFFLWLWPMIDSTAPNLFTTKQHKRAPLLFLWLAADLCLARAGGRYYPHYFLPALLSLVIVSCVGIDILARMASQLRYSQVFVCTLLIPIGIAGLKGQVDSYHSAMGKPPDEWAQAAIFIRDHKSPLDTMFTWEFRPRLYRIADSHTVTRWASAHYILDSPDAYNWIGGELMAELRVTPPSFVVYACNDSFAEAGNSVRNQFMEFVSEEYRVVYRTGEVCVSQRS